MFANGDIKGINGGRNVNPPSHMFYADDLLIFCDVALMNAVKIIRVLNKYGHISGQMINKTKSTFMLGKGADSRVTRLKEATGMVATDLPIKYVISRHKLVKSVFMASFCILSQFMRGQVRCLGS